MRLIRLGLCFLFLGSPCYGTGQQPSPIIHVPGESAKSVTQPVVLGLQQIQPYIAAIMTHREQIGRAFGNNMINVDFSNNSGDPDSPYAPQCQAFAFPNGQTVFAFDTLAEKGAVVFNTDTHEIIKILPWSREVQDAETKRTPDEKGAVVFDRTFYRIRQAPSGEWVITALVFAIFGDKYNPRYETWEFSYSPMHQARSLRHTMKQYVMK